MNKQVLNAVDKNQIVWLKLQEQIEDDLRVMRMKLETNLGTDETTDLRGQIKYAKKMLLIGAEPHVKMTPASRGIE